MTAQLPSTLSDHPQLVGIVRFPSCTVTTQEVPIPLVLKIDNKYQSMRQVVDMATNITGLPVTSESYTINKTNVTDFYPYTYYVLTDGECDPLIMYPQYMPSNLTIKGVFALSNQPVERYYPSEYKGDTTGAIYNITNTNQMMLPCATNEGLAQINANSTAMAQSRKNQVTGNILNAVGSVVSAVANPMTIGYGVANIINGLNEVKQTDARNKDLMLTPSTLSSFGTPSTRSAFGTDSVKLIKYTVKDNVKTKINNFVSRYGNKFNSYGVIDLKNYKGYVKFISPDIDTNIDLYYLNKLIQILERGVFVE